MTEFPDIAQFLILDRDVTFLDGLKGAITKGVGADVTAYADPRDARDAVVRAGFRPAVIVTDRVGLNPLETNKTFVSQAREESPLTIIILYSEGAYQLPNLVTEWLEMQAVDVALRKGDQDKLLSTLRAVSANWNSPGAAALRSQLKRGVSIDVPYFTDGEHTFSMVDEHREMVLGTPAGDASEKAWQRFEREI